MHEPGITDLFPAKRSGIEEDKLTGLTALVTGALFLPAIFPAPLVGFIPSVAIAQVLIIVEIMMI